MFVALVTQHAKRARCIIFVFFGLSDSTIFWPVRLYNIFIQYLINGTIFEKKKLLNTKLCVLVSLQHFSYYKELSTVPGSIPDGVTGFFSDIFPSDRNMALGSTQPLVEMSTGNIS